MIRHISLTLGATVLALGALIALPDSVTSTAHYAAPDASQTVPVTAADTCAETIMAELDTLQESTSAHIPGIPWQTIVADCDALGTDPAYVKHVGPALPECVQEDGSGGPMPCYWDAQTRGNGRGVSYIAVAPDRAAECDAALTYAAPDMRAVYLPLCTDGYAIEGVTGKAYAG